MSGENSKRSGDFGEEIVKNLLHLFGWDNPIQNISVDCVRNDKHKIDGAEKRVKHGIDFLFQYKSPLKDIVQQNVIVSVKHRDGYPATERGKKSKFKEFLMDIAYAIECFPTSIYYKNKTPGTSKKELTGVIFWIDSSDDQKNKGVVNEIADSRISDEVEFKTICLVDNLRASFLYYSIKFVHNKYSSENVEFFYLDTGYNITSLKKSYSGKILPVEYINSDVLPFKIKDKENGEILLLAVNDGFKEEYLKRLIGLAQDFTRNWASKIIIAFPDYNPYYHEKDVLAAKNQFDDSDFIMKIDIVSYNPTFKTMQEE